MSKENSDAINPADFEPPEESFLKNEDGKPFEMYSANKLQRFVFPVGPSAVEFWVRKGDKIAFNYELRADGTVKNLTLHVNCESLRGKNLKEEVEGCS